MNHRLFVTNTLTRQKELFTPINKSLVNMYVCGITPYDYAHIGHGRVYVTFDIVYRLLKFLGYQVTYCRNFTDIDDKLINNAEQELGDGLRYHELAEKFITAYHQDMQNLNCLKPDFEPLVTQTIPEIIEFINRLILKNHAYVTNGNVYYSVKSFANYGKLSRQDLSELEVGARIHHEPDKRNPLDFALWKSTPENLFWQSPWGWGRPGWHIECSAMASKFLGNHIDLHAGGQDLIFPHHENEIAQSEGLNGAPFAKYWMHNAFVQINKTKMSKSLSNSFTLKDVFDQIDPMVLRYYFANHNYNTPLDFDLAELHKIQKSYNRLCLALDNSKPSHNSKSSATRSTFPGEALREACEPEAARGACPGEALREAWELVEPCGSNNQSPIIEKLLLFLCDDLNTSGLFGVIFENLSTLSNHEKFAVKSFLQQVLGLKMVYIPEKQVELTPEINQLISLRTQARANKDWATADQLRAELAKLGYHVQDK
jgi:cysteinyl-tRNA synthetase